MSSGRNHRRHTYRWQKQAPSAGRKPQPQPRLPGDRSTLLGSLPELKEKLTLDSSPPPPPPPPQEPKEPRSNPGGDPPGGGSWQISRERKVGVFILSLLLGGVFAYLFGDLADDMTPAGTVDAAAFWTPGNLVRLFFVGAGLAVGIAYAIHDSFRRTLGAVVVGMGVLAAAAYMVDTRRPEAVAAAQPAVVDSMPSARPGPSPEGNVPAGPGVRPTVPMPDGSDVEHRGDRRNVAVGRAGQRVKHPILLLNQGQTWWRDRLLCREGTEQDSRAIVSEAACIPIPTVPPGESVELTLEFTAPPVPGWYVARWKQATHEAGFIYRGAEPVILHVRVDEPF